MENMETLKVLMFAVWCAIVVMVYILESKKFNDNIRRIIEQKMFDLLEPMYNKNRYTVILYIIVIVIGYVIIM